MNRPVQHPGKHRIWQLQHSQAGVTLIEVLITVVILSIGLLGIAALQLTSLRNGTDSVSRSKATWLAADIIDHMRANRNAAIAGNYDIDVGTAASGGSRADLDLTAWKALLSASATNNAGLPLGDGGIRRDGNIFTITVRWRERNADLTFVTQTEI